MRLFQRICLTVLATIATQVAFSQNPAPMPVPVWVTMMEDPNTNFFEAVRAYDDFWRGRKKPKQEAEIFEVLEGKGKETDKSLAELEAERQENLGPALQGKELEETEYLKYEIKRFEKWMLEVKPWVQENGHILTYEERQAIWKKQQEEIQNQEKK